MRIDVLTLFPEMFDSPLSHSILRRAQVNGVVEIALSNIRDYALNGKYNKVDDTPYGGGPGMVMICKPVVDCVRAVDSKAAEPAKVIMMTPQGEPFSQKVAKRLSGEKRLMFIAGRYEGFDERIKETLDAEEISIGDYCLSGGELAAMVVIDAVVRLLPGALGDDSSSHDESFSDGLLEYPHYTRPVEFEGRKVPDVLLSGNHGKIAEWRLEQSKERTKEKRPDLWASYSKIENLKE